MRIRIPTIAKGIVLAMTIVAFVLLLTTTGCIVNHPFLGITFSGVEMLFGGDGFHLVVVSLIAWIITIVVMVAMLVLLAAEFFEIDLINNFESYILIGISFLLIASGIMIICSPVDIKNQLGVEGNYSLSGGWITVVVMLFTSGGICFGPLVCDFLGIKQ